GDEALQVRAHAVDVADAGQDRDERLVVVAKAHPAIGQLPEMLDVEGVARLRTVDRDGDDVAVLLVVDRHAHRLTPGCDRTARIRRGRVRPSLAPPVPASPRSR